LHTDVGTAHEVLDVTLRPIPLSDAEIPVNACSKLRHRHRLAGMSQLGPYCLLERAQIDPAGASVLLCRLRISKALHGQGVLALVQGRF
jgi:hypothetical protein